MNDQTLQGKLCTLATTLADWNLMIPERENMSPTVLLDGLLILLDHDFDSNVFKVSHNYNLTDMDDVGYYLPTMREPEVGDVIMFTEIMEDPTKLGILVNITEDEYTVVRFHHIRVDDRAYYRISKEIIPKDYPDIGIFYHL